MSGECRKCLLSDENNKKCGPCKQLSEAPKTGVCAITAVIAELKVDVTTHLRSLHFKDNLQQDTYLDERKLIENRIGYEIDDYSFICAYHRNAYGVGWLATQHCCHPEHPPYIKGTKTKKTQLAPMWLVSELNGNVPFSLPVGGKVCREYTPLHPAKKQRVEPDERANLKNSLNESFENASYLDESFQPEELTVPVDVQSNLAEAGNQLTSLCNMSPIKFQVVKSPVNQLSTRVKSDFKKKLLMVKDQSVRLLAESLAPNQGEHLLAECFDEKSNGSASEDDVPDDLKSLVQVYEDTTDRQARIVILSLVEHSKYSKSIATGDVPLK